MIISRWWHGISNLWRQGDNSFKHSDQIVSQQVKKGTDYVINHVELPSLNNGNKTLNQNYQEPNSIPNGRHQNNHVDFDSNISSDSNYQQNSELTELKNNNSTYIRENYIYKNEKFSLSKGKQIKNNENTRILIKEYNLTNIGFHNQELIKTRQQTFRKILESDIKISDGLDFRIIRLIDAFDKDNKCYLITKDISNAISLADYLAQNQAMTAKQIRQVIRQVLESLHFLHRFCRVNLKSKSIKGIPHGNININSLLINYSNVLPTVIEERQFYIYLTNLELWEHLFSPEKQIADNKEDLGSEKQDLKDLAVVAFMLAGGQLNSNSLRPADFTSEQPWFSLQDDELKQFIQRLAGFGSSFDGADEAYNILKNLPEPKPQLPVEVLELPILPVHEKEKTNKFSFTFNLPLLFIILSAISIISFIVWSIYPDVKNLISNFPHKPQSSSTNPPQTCQNNNCYIQSVPDINNILQGDISLFVENPEIRFSQLHPSTREANDTNDKNYLFEVLRTRIGNSKLNIQTQDAKNRDEIINKLKNGLNPSKKTNLALMRLPSKERPQDKLPLGLITSSSIAHDALVVIVAFNDASTGTAAEALSGKIKLEDLRELYMKQNSEEKTIKIGEKTQKVKTYFPQDKDTVKLFEQLVLGGKGTSIFNQEYQNQLSMYKNYKKKDIFAFISENDQNNSSVIKIGFERVSKVIGQCSVYPLAIVTDQGKEIQLITDSQGSIKPNDSNLDLCGDKGSYWVDKDNLDKYPLKYDIGFIFQEKDSNIGYKLAEVLNTYEGQYLLSQIGLVPTIPMEDIRKIRW